MRGSIVRTSVLLIVAPASLIWAGGLLWRAWPDLQVHAVHIRLGWLSLTMALSLASAYLAFEAFRVLIERLRPGALGRRQLAHLYFMGQLMRHLPGRFWGLAYQASASTAAGVAEWVAVNAVHTVLSMGFGLAAAAILLAARRGPLLGGLSLMLMLSLYVALWQPRPLRFALRALEKVPLRALAGIAAALAPFVDADAATKRQVGSLMAVSWVVYYLAWGCFGMSWPGLDWQAGMSLCALYTLAWFVGYISLLTPSGLGIRELTFVLLAHRYPTDAVAAMAIFGRAILLSVDIALAVVFAPFSPARSAE
jgi:hypothetical protein